MCIEELRRQIDQVDRQLIETLAKRECLVKQIHAIKKRQDLALYSAEREREILANAGQIATMKGLSIKPIKQLYLIVLRQFAQPVTVQCSEPDTSGDSAQRERKHI